MRTSKSKLIPHLIIHSAKKPPKTAWTLTLFALWTSLLLSPINMPTRYDILDFVFQRNSSPAQDNFKDVCSEWIYSNFPLAKSEDVDKFLKNFIPQSIKKWNEAKSSKQTLYQVKKYKGFFSIEVHFQEDQSAEPAAMEVDLPPEIDLSSPKQFAQFVCPAPGCGFKDKSDVKFKRHVVAKHPFVAGK